MKCDNIELIKAARAGSSEALAELVANNTGLVCSIAKRFIGRGTDYDDLCQIGHVGMIKAIKNFDIGRGTQFSTYAVPLIIGEIKRFLRDDGDIKISREIKRKARILAAESEKFYSLNGREPTVSEAAALCGLSEEETVECIGASGATVSLSETFGEITVEERLGKDFTPELNEKIALKQAIGCLDDEEKMIITLRYFKNLTQSEVGRVLGISQVTVSRREAKALEKLKSELS